MEHKKSVQISVGTLPLPTRTTVDKGFYAQWERKSAGNNNSGEKLTSLTVRTGSSSLSPGPKSASKASNVKNRYLPKLATAEEDAAERIRLLELKSMSARTAISNYKKRKRELIAENLEMKRAIQAEEKPNHQAVKTLMRRYEKFRGGISYLDENFTTTLQSETQQLNQLENKLEADLDFTEKEVQDLDRKLKNSENQVYVLNNYKDKEYPVKAIRIGELMTELDQVELTNDDEYFDLERIIDDELHKLNREGNQTETDIKESALNVVLDQMHPSLREMAKQNQVMDTEIGYHKHQIIQTQRDIEVLKEQVQQLISHPKTNVRLQVFPELFKYDTICTPDMDVVLDIPKVELLPI